MAGRHRTFNYERAFELYRAGVAGVEIARQVGASHEAVRNAISSARKRGVDLGPRRPIGWRTDSPRRPWYSRDPFYNKLRRVGYSRDEAIAALHQTSPRFGAATILEARALTQAATDGGFQPSVQPKPHLLSEHVVHAPTIAHGDDECPGQRLPLISRKLPPSFTGPQS